MLRAAGYDVISHASLDDMAPGGARAPVAVLVDSGLPGLDPSDFARRVRSAWPDRFIALIALGSHAGGAAQRMADHGGMDAAAGKFDRAGLISTLAQAAGLHASIGRAA